MSYSIKVSNSILGEGERLISEIDIVADGMDKREVALDASASNAQINFALDVSQAKLIYIQADRATTLKTNSSSEPTETKSLTAGVALFWFEGCGWDNPFASDITALYATNGTATASTLSIVVLFDATP